MKKIASVLLTLVIVISCFSLPSAAAAEKKGYSASAGSTYLMDIDQGVDELYYEFSDNRKIDVEKIGDENFIVLEKPYCSDGKSSGAKNNSTLSLTVDAANLTFKARNKNYSGEGLPEAIRVGDDLSAVYIGFRIKIEDNSAAFSDATATMRISLKSSIDKVTQLTTNYSQYFYWLDLNDGSMTAAHTQSGYMPANKYRNSNSRTSGIEFTGDMDGYLLIPIQFSASDNPLISKAKLQSDFKNIVFEFRTGDTDVDGNPAKKSSWEDKTFFLGNGFLVTDVDSFASEKSSKRNNAGQMYSPVVDDTAFYAMRVGGYRSFDQVRVGDAFGKMPFDPADTNPIIQSNRHFVHITTLPNGDRARELILNSENNSDKAYTSGEAMLSMYDTYDFSKIDQNGAVNKHGVRTKGVPSEIDLSGTKYLAFRIATKDGSKKNEKVEFSIRLTPSESASSASDKFRTTPYYLTEGEVTYLDCNTLKSRKITVSGGSKDKLISVEGNLDGYLIIPISRFNTKSDGSGSALDKNVIQTRWGAYFNYANQGIYYIMQSGFENGKALYAGDIFFVSNEQEFIKVRTTDCRAVGHKAVTVPAVEATCIQEGVSEGKKCSVCEQELRGFETTQKVAHDYKLEETVKPTQSSKGYELYKCETCGGTIKKDYGEKLQATSSDTQSDSELPVSSEASSKGENSVASDESKQQDADQNEGGGQDKISPVILVVIIVLAALLIAGAVVFIILKKRTRNK